MDLFTYLMAKNDHNTSVNKDLFSYLLGKNQSGTYTDYSGTSISANNTKKGKMQLSLKGNTSQTGTPTPSTPIPVNVVSGDNEVVVCGKNLLNLTQFTTRTLNGITFTKNSEGSITLNGTATAEITLDTPISINLTSGTSYIISQGTTYSGSNYAISMRNQNYSVVTDTSCDSSLASKQFTFSSTTQPYYFRIYIVNGKSFNNHTIYPMVRLATITDDTYEPYQSQTYEVDLPVENLVNAMQESFTLPETSATWQKIISNTTADNKVHLVAGTKYYISYTIENSSTSNTRSTPRLYLDSSNYYQNGNTNRNLTTGRKVDEYTPTTTGDYGVEYWLQGSNVAVTISDFMISTINASYTPYGTTPIELCKIGNYKDYFTKNSGKNLVEGEIENGSIDGSGYIGSNSSFTMWYAKITQGETYTVSTDESNLVAGFFYTQPSLNSTAYNNTRLVQENKTFTAPITGYIAFRTTVNYAFAQCELGNSSTTYEPYGKGLWCKYNAIEKITLPSDLGGYNSGNNWYYISSSIVNGNIINTDMLCNKLAYKSNITDSSQTIGIGINSALTNFIIKNPNCTTQEQYRTFLATGVLLYYVLQTPYLSLIEDNNLIEQLDNLYNAMSYSGTTNINQVNDDLPFNIDAKIKVGN